MSAYRPTTEVPKSYTYGAREEQKNLEIVKTTI